MELLHVLFAPEGAEETILCAVLWMMLVAIGASYSPRLFTQDVHDDLNVDNPVNVLPARGDSDDV